MIPPLKEKPLDGNNWTRPWYLFFDGLNRYVTGLLNALKFTDLTDTPSSYNGQAGKAVKVNVGETGLEFGSSNHNDLAGLQGGVVGEYYHLTSADSSEAVSFLNGGTSTHTQLDTERTDSSSHRADATIHFTQAQIDHVNILNKGTNTHAQIDTHIANLEIHGIEYDERNWVITNGLVTGVVYELLGATVETMTITHDTSDRPLQYSYAVSGKVVDLVHLGTGFLSGAV